MQQQVEGATRSKAKISAKQHEEACVCMQVCLCLRIKPHKISRFAFHLQHSMRCTACSPSTGTTNGRARLCCSYASQRFIACAPALQHTLMPQRPMLIINFAFFLLLLLLQLDFFLLFMLKLLCATSFRPLLSALRA